MSLDLTVPQFMICEPGEVYRQFFRGLLWNIFCDVAVVKSYYINHGHNWKSVKQKKIKMAKICVQSPEVVMTGE